MNGNRSRYSTNPTFSMQKRSIFKKPFQPLLEKPDFTSAGEPAKEPVQNTSAQNLPLGAPPVPPVNELFGSPAPSPTPASMPMPGIPNGSINFTPAPQQPPAAMQQTGVFNIQSAAPLSFGQPSGQNLPPLGNQNLSAPGGAFSSHSQGFTPPQNTQFPAPLLGNQGAGTKNAGPAAPTVQPAAFANPFEAPAMQQPGFNAAFTPQQQPVKQGKGAGQPVDTETLLKLFLFVLIPVLFVPCLLIPTCPSLLRYLFAGMCAVAIGILWHRGMFSSNARIAATLAYALAGIIVVVMLFRGSTADPQNVQNNPGNVQQQQQQTMQNGMPAAAGDPAVAQPTFTPTPEPTPSIPPVSEAETRLEAFMVNWSGARIEDLVRLVQPSWASAQDNPSNRLFVLLGNRTPLSYNIEEISGSDNDSSRTVTMTANIDKNNGKDPTLYRFMVLMVKEGGEWYVDPNSLATNDQVTIKEETNTVNDSRNTTAENWTIAPRQTVTPAPPASQLLYYNPNGGSMYHLDQYCPSVYDEYLPLGGSFPYSELGSHQDKTPCLRCGAPTQTLPPDSLGQ